MTTEGIVKCFRDSFRLYRSFLRVRKCDILSRDDISENDIRKFQLFHLMENTKGATPSSMRSMVKIFVKNNFPLVSNRKTTKINLKNDFIFSPRKISRSMEIAENTNSATPNSIWSAVCVSNGLSYGKFPSRPYGKCGKFGNKWTSGTPWISKSLKRYFRDIAWPAIGAEMIVGPMRCQKPEMLKKNRDFSIIDYDG